MHKWSNVLNDLSDKQTIKIKQLAQASSQVVNSRSQQLPLKKRQGKGKALAPSKGFRWHSRALMGIPAVLMSSTGCCGWQPQSRRGAHLSTRRRSGRHSVKGGGLEVTPLNADPIPKMFFLVFLNKIKLRSPRIRPAKQIQCRSLSE
jgi:hypothetical protein